jgi:hypothetical protein
MTTSNLGYAVMTRAGRFFRYDSGHYDYADRPENATFFHDPKEIARAMKYAMSDSRAGGGELTVVDVYVQVKPVPFSYESVIREAALEKLDAEEKRILGL